MRDDNELILRAHIRELLTDYAYTHLTVDHVQYSNTIVSDILGKVLKPIPTHGPGEISLPADPFETLKTRLKFDSLTPYTEVWRPNPEALSLIKATYLAPKAAPRTETVWEDEDDFDYERMPHRPMSPVLSRSSRNKTPSFGTGLKRNSREESLAESLSSHRIQQVPDEQLPDENPPRLEDCLDLKLTIDSSTHSDVVQLQKQAPFLARPVPRALPIHALEFLRTSSPDYQEKFTSMSPPLFAREHDARSSVVEKDWDIAGRLKLEPLEVPELDPDVAMESMKVIDGWVTLQSGTSTPSLSSGTSEVDELDQDADFWRPSSSLGSPAGIETLESAKMDPPLFPRAERLRAGKTNSPGERQEQSLSKFITAHMPSMALVGVLTSPKSDDLQPELDRFPAPSVSAVSLSMMGQPPSESETSSAPASDSIGDTFDKGIRRILKVHSSGRGLESYQDVIMDERLDEKETMFMDVLKLPPPNQYLRVASDRTLGSVPVFPRGKVPEVPRFTVPKYSKKVMGLKSLNLELSWRPFTFGSKIPTHSELLDADSVFHATNSLESEDPTEGTVHKRLTGLIFPIELENESGCNNLGSSADSDERIGKDMLDDVDFENLGEKFNADRHFGDDALLLCRSDRLGLPLRAPLQDLQQLSTDDVLTLHESQSNEISDFSSVITDLDRQFPLTQQVDDAGAYTQPLTYPTDHHAPVSDLDDAYDGYQEYEDERANRNGKKRRLTAGELDGLCSMEAMSQSGPITIDPKDLMLEQPSYITHEFNPEDFDAILPGTQQISYALSQSRSLSLSLVEDNASQDAVAVNTINNALDRDLVAYRNSVPYPTDQALGDHRPFLNDSQQDAFHPSAPVQMDDHPKDGTLYLAHESPADREVCPQLLHSTKTNAPQKDAGGRESQTIHTEREAVKSRHQKAASLSEPYSEHDRLSTFLLLRGKGITKKVSRASPERPVHGQGNIVLSGSKDAIRDQDFSVQTCRSASAELLCDTRAFSIPDPWQPPDTEHTYLISIGFVQQRALVHALESPHCMVRLIERDVISPPVSIEQGVPEAHTGEISIIVGPHSGVVFFPLSALPSETAYKTLLNALAAHSWRFSSVLLILMAFPRSRMIRATNVDRASHDGPSWYSPPVLKAARRIRRDLALRDGTGEKRVSCTIELAFADDVQQAATFVRAFGDLSLRDSQVDFVSYIGEEEQEGERDLAELEGMNSFCAAIILQCCTLEQFLEMPPEKRTGGLTDLIGQERVELVNTVLDKRMQQMEMELPSPPESEVIRMLGG